jgi:prepilin-type N-terminal cleavage/methylation domain-containing protein
MLVGSRRRAGAAPRQALERPSDAGFTLVEMLVAVMLIGVVMTALTTFFVRTVSVMSQQSGKQAGIQLADDGTERVRSIKGSAITVGRDRTSTDNQWASPVPGVAPYLADMQKAWDAAATFPAGATAPLPTSARTVTVNGLSYGQNWYVGRCWQAPAGGTCGATQTTGHVEFFRVVVAVTWSESQCPNSLCSYVTSTLISSAASEPVFNTNLTAGAPAVNNPGAQVGEVSVPVSLQLTAAGGAPPGTWAGSGLPTGVSISSAGLISGTPSAAGTYAVTVTTTDSVGFFGTAAFTWTINALPTLTNPGSQTTAGGTAVSLAISRAGGTAPFTWSVTAPGPWGATGLPAGLSINASTGVISGTSTTAGSAKDVTVTVTDSFAKSASVTFTWTIPPVQIQTPAAQTSAAGTAVTPLQIVASNGIPPYSWSASGLPPGLSIGSTGQITGSPTTGGAYNATVTVTDAGGGTASTSSFTWTVTSQPDITGPSGARSSVSGEVISVQFTVSGGRTPYTWAATNLPAGLTMSSAGLISGTITSGTRYIATVTVTDGGGATDSDTFVWTVSGGVPRVVAPTGDRTGDSVGQNVTIVAQASGAGSSHTWTVTGLPPGVTMSSGGVITGQPTSAGTYTVRLTAHGSGGKVATFMFTWTIQ